MASSDSTAPFGLPGKFTMSVRCRDTTRPRDNSAVGVFSTPLRRISSAKPGMLCCATSSVASGVLSRGPSPVPPVVNSRSTRFESASSRNWLRTLPGSSEHRSVAFTSQPNSRQRCTRAGPERSMRSPRATESLIVSMATRMAGLLAFDGVAIGFVQHAHGFHEEAGGAARRRRGSRCASGVKVNLELALGPQNHLEDRIVALKRADLRVAALPVGKIQFRLVLALAHHQAAGFLAYFQRLHQVGHVHFFQAALNHAGTRSAL